MNFDYTEEQLALKAQIRAFCEKEIKPEMRRLEDAQVYPLRTIKMLGEMGFMGMPFPREYGGMGLDYLTYVMLVEEISKISPSHGVAVQTHHALATWPIFTYGTEEQKRKYVPDLASGRKIGAFGLTEPNAGTDAAMQQTIAEDKGDYWLLNGSKMFISGAGVADVYVVMAMTDKSKGNHGISAFIVEKGMPGFSFGTNEDKLGIRSSTVAELLFNNCRVPKENLLYEEGKGFKVAMTALDVGRLGIAAQALGIAQESFDMTVRYMKHREQFGKPLSSLQALSFTMAELETKIEGARFLLYRAADHLDQGKSDISVTAAKAKLACSTVAMETTLKAVQFHGGYGYIKDLPLERYMRDAKITEIYEGTSEVMKMVISGGIFGRGAKHEEKQVRILKDASELKAVLAEHPGDICWSGGRGLTAAGFEKLQQLAEKTGGGFGASRGAVRAGLAKEEDQVGLTGRTVAPAVYVAVGISGMTQHLAGMKGSGLVVAINRNPQAPIFAAADVGLVGDAEEILDELLAIL